jgi:CRP/FNR family cyclic AMP-dependent transcriptional regulator
MVLIDAPPRSANLTLQNEHDQPPRISKSRSQQTLCQVVDNLRRRAAGRMGGGPIEPPAWRTYPLCEAWPSGWGLLVISTTGESMDSRTVAAFLSQVELFEPLDSRSLATLAERAWQQTMKRGQAIFVQDEPGDRMFVLVDGTVKLFIRFQSGDIIELIRHTPPASFGEVSLLDGGRRSATAEAVSDGRLLAIARDDVMEIIRAEPETIDKLLHALGAIIRRTTDQVTELAFLGLQGRVARRLLLLAEGFEDDEVQGVSQAEFASMVGGSRQSVNEVLKRLEQRGFIAMTRGRVTAIRDARKLREFAKGLVRDSDPNPPNYHR